MVETCDRRTGECAHGTGESISAPHATANAAIRATTHSGSIVEPGQGQGEQQRDGPARATARRSRGWPAPARPGWRAARAPTTTSAPAVAAPRPPCPVCARPRRDRIISAAPPGTRRSCGRRPSRAPSRRRSAGTGRRAGARRSRRRCGRRRGASPSASRRAPRGAGGRAPSVLSSPAGRRGSRRARQRISSASRLPTPATTAWSMSRAFSGAAAAAHARAELVARDLGGVGAQRRRGRAPGARGPGGACRAGPAAPPSSKCTTKRSQPRGAGSSSIAMRPAMPRCRPSTGPSSEVSTHIALPRRCAAVSSRPTSASAISPGACGRQT